MAIKDKDAAAWWNGSAWQPTFAWAGDAVLGSPGAPSTSWSFAWTPTDTGNFAVQVRADDTAGNKDPTKPFVSFSVTDGTSDAVSPDGTVTVPSDNEDFAFGPITFDGMATDDVGVVRVRVAIKDKDGAAWWNGSAWQPTFAWAGDATLGSPGATATSWNFDWFPTGTGRFAVMVRADDAAGNIDPTKPFVSFTVS